MPASILKSQEEALQPSDLGIPGLKEAVHSGHRCHLESHWKCSFTNGQWSRKSDITYFSRTLT